MKLKDELPRSVDAHYDTREEWRNNPRKNEETEPKQKQHPVVDVIDDGNLMMYRKILHRNMDCWVHKSR